MYYAYILHKYFFFVTNNTFMFYLYSSLFCLNKNIYCTWYNIMLFSYVERSKNILFITTTLKEYK